MPDQNNLNIRSFIMDKDKMGLFKERLKSKGFSFSDTLSNRFLKWRAKKDGVLIDAYTSGKVVVHGKAIKSLLADTDLWVEIIETQNEDEDIIGIDEAGKGDYFGPLVVGAVLVRSGQWKDLALMGIRDSKTLSDPQISRISSEIKKRYPHSLVAISPERYNQLYVKIRNLNKLLAWGHARSLENILNHWDSSRAISDQFGDKSFLLSALMEKGKNIQLEQAPRAEKNLAVAAASILARNEFLMRLASLGKRYDMMLPKGAGIKVIQVGRDFIRQHGSKELCKVAKIHFKTTRDIEAHLKKE